MVIHTNSHAYMHARMDGWRYTWVQHNTIETCALWKQYSWRHLLLLHLLCRAWRQSRLCRSSKPNTYSVHSFIVAMSWQHIVSVFWWF